MFNEAKKILISLGMIILILLVAGLAKPLLASVRCETQYEGEVCWEMLLELDKRVWDPEDGEFKDNLVNTDDYKFSPGEEITYQLTIKNTGEKMIDKINVKDYLPSYLRYVSGDHEFEIYNLDAGQSVVKEFKAAVVNNEYLPDQEVICDANTSNWAKAWSDDDYDDDTAQICIKKKVLGVKVIEELPPTGPQTGILLLGFSLLSGLTGLSLIKKGI
jgi:uncharacterized repeat protein (TIGR01451 family)